MLWVVINNNKLVLFTTGSSAVAIDGWTNLNTASGGSYEYDFIHVDASGNQVYYFNPRSDNLYYCCSYSFRMWAENSITPHNYGFGMDNYKNYEMAIKVADPGQTNGFLQRLFMNQMVFINQGYCSSNFNSYRC